MKITKRQLRRIIREEKQKLLREAFSAADIDANQGTRFGLVVDGEGEVIGDLLNPEDLRALAKVLEMLYSGTLPAEEVFLDTGFDEL